MAPRIPLFKRLVIGLCNLIFPPVAVWLLTGLNEDVLVNSVLFLLAVFPSHIHGFYISLTYFNRKRKVRNGVYPGDKRSGIWSDKVNYGGASRREVLLLKEERDFGKSSEKLKRNSSTERPSMSRRLSNRIDQWDDGFKETISRQSSRERPSGTLTRTVSGRSLQRESPTDPAAKTPTRSRSRSLTRRVSDRLEDQVRKRLEDREDRRRKRGEDNDVEVVSSNGAATEAQPVLVEGVRRWR